MNKLHNKREPSAKPSYAPPINVPMMLRAEMEPLIVKDHIPKVNPRKSNKYVCKSTFEVNLLYKAFVLILALVLKSSKLAHAAREIRYLNDSHQIKKQ